MRLIAGEFADTIFTVLKQLRMHVAVRACAVEPTTKQQDDENTYWLASSSMLIVGPVGHIKMLKHGGSGEWPKVSETRGCGVRIEEPVNEELAKMEHTLACEVFTGKAGEDESRGWPIIQNLKQKKVLTVLPHTKKMLIFMGANESRRTPEALAARYFSRRERADKWVDKTWSQPYKSGAKGKGRGRPFKEY